MVLGGGAGIRTLVIVQLKKINYILCVSSLREEDKLDGLVEEHIGSRAGELLTSSCIVGRRGRGSVQRTLFSGAGGLWNWNGAVF